MASTGNVQVGKPAPDFRRTAVVDGRLEDVTLSSYTDANHWLILMFFPKAWSSVCLSEIRAFSARLEEFLYSRHCAVVFASTDSEICLQAWHGTSETDGGLGGVHAPLISDCSQKMSKDYGVLVEEQGVAQRALFIIDPKGIIRGITINDAYVARSVDETQRQLDGLAFKDESGEGCPSDWKKGDTGIDIASPSQNEGQLQLKKSWSEWARPRLQRAFSGASQRSVSSGLDGKPDLTLGNGVVGAAYQAHLASSYPSPALSPTSTPMRIGMMQAQMEEAIVEQQRRMENISAAVQNQSLGSAN